jgi:predicted nucleic acid-binding protein
MATLTLKNAPDELHRWRKESAAQHRRSLNSEAICCKDPDWIAPALWRSEFRNVLIQSLRHGFLSLDEILNIMNRAEGLMKDNGYQMDSSRILRLAAVSGCAACDCEFVELALDSGVPLVTSDRALIEKFKPDAVSMTAFCS